MKRKVKEGPGTSRNMPVKRTGGYIPFTIPPVPAHELW